MATFLGRRYVRPAGAVGSREKVLGIALLLLAAGIAVGFVLHARTPGAPLFASGQAAESAVDESREATVARQMLPALDDLGWRAAGEAQALRPDDDALGDLGSAAVAYGAGQVYLRTYNSAGGDGLTLRIAVCDARTPAQAFGLCGARRPRQWEGLPGARDGWLDGSGMRAGFWQGRYYTELRAAAPDPTAAPGLASVAGAVGGTQLDYGGPFRVAGFLPTEGRVPGSLRYVHRSALGRQGLDEVFLVDLEDGLTAWAMEARDTAAAHSVLETLRTQRSASGGAGGRAEPGPGGAAGRTPRYVGPITLLPGDDGSMAVFAAGRLVQGFQGAGEDAVLAAAERAYASAVPEAAATAAAPEAEATSEAENPFPTPAEPGWRVPTNVARFSPENLYVKIDGRAELYLQFQVVGLTFGTYAHQTDPDLTIDVYWYDMGTPANALGVYQAEATPGAEAVDVGQEGYVSGGAVFFRAGGSYFQVLPMSAGVEPATTVDIAARLAEQVRSTADDLWAETLLPSVGRIDGTFTYLAQDAFSLGFLDDVYTADYLFDGDRFTLFLHRAADDSAAEALFQRYLNFFQDFGRLSWQEEGPRLIAAGDVGGVVDVVFVTGRFLAGVTGAEDPGPARRVAEAFHDEVSAH